jgi:ATP phosphoribosyltransferase
LKNLSFALPVSGALYDGSMDLLKNCGLSVSRSNNRVYTATIPNLLGLDVMFQRQSDIPSRLDSNVADIGIVGLDSFYESKIDNGTSLVLIDDLGFGKSDLVLAVPDAWLDVKNLVDLADLSFKMRDQGRDLRIATKYPRLVSRFLNNNSIYYFDIVDASGGIEVAPYIGYADMICDITATGNTLRQNRLKIVENGTVFSSQAALVGNIQSLAKSSNFLTIKPLIEKIEAYMNAKKYIRVTVNLSLEDLGLSSPEDLPAVIGSNHILHGLKGPSFSYVLTTEPGTWISLELIILNDQLLSCIEELRNLGGVSITSSNLSMLFYKDSIGYSKLLEAISLLGDEE